MIRILIADDHHLVRSGIRSILEGKAGWEICAEASDGYEAVALTRQLKPDIVILDFYMPRLNGLDAARQILNENIRQKLLFLTVVYSEEVAWQILNVGARGYVLKSDAAHELVDAIESLLRNRLYCTARISSMVLGGYLKPNSAAYRATESLTVRERQIVQLIAEGYVTKEAAAMLGISIKTAETHRSNIMRKLHIHSVAELVLYAVRNNLVQSASSNWLDKRVA